MKRKKNAFTLIEILVTLGVIGIVAALTLPGIIDDTKKKTAAAELARCTELTQTGIANVMHQVGKHTDGAVSADKLSDIKVSDVFGASELTDNYLTNGQTLFTSTRGPMGITEVDNSYLSGVKTYAGGSISNLYANFSSSNVYQFIKRHSVIIVEDINDANAANADKDEVIARIFFDINGKDGPNVLAKDIFLFGLTNGGHLVPAGSNAYNQNTMNETIPLFAEACNDGVTDGRSCSARIMNDKWKINY